MQQLHLQLRNTLALLNQNCTLDKTFFMKALLKTFKVAASFVLVITLLTSCTHYYYGPNSNNVPMLENKGDVRILAAAASAEESSGFELQTAYAAANHFGVMLNLYTATGKDESSSTNGTNTTERGNGLYIEAGGGYFTYAGKTTNWIFETYAGVGTGSIKNQYGNAEQSKVGVTKFFLQPSIGYVNNRGTFQAAISSRFSSVHLAVKESNVTVNSSEDFTQVATIKSNPNYIFWEPSILFRFGIPHAKLQLQLTPSSAFSKPDINFQQNVFSIGIFFAFKSTPVK